MASSTWVPKTAEACELSYLVNHLKPLRPSKYVLSGTVTVVVRSGSQIGSPNKLLTYTRFSTSEREVETSSRPGCVTLMQKHTSRGQCRAIHLWHALSLRKMKNFETNSKRMEIQTVPVATSDYRGCFSSHFISISNMCKKLKKYQGILLQRFLHNKSAKRPRNLQVF